MNWFDWLKDLGGHSPEGEGPGGRPRKVSGAEPSRRAGRGGHAYDKEWVRVLDDSAPERDPFNTYTWELDTESGLPREPAAEPPRRKPAQDPDDTYTWELQQDDNPASDPWGLAEAENRKAQAGGNPYDTGVFTGGWDERSKAR